MPSDGPVLESDPGPSARLCYRVPVAPHAIRTIRLTIESFARDRGFGAAKVCDLALALSEALFNAVEHGNQGDRYITVEVLERVDGVEVAVEDDGAAGDCERRIAEMRQMFECGCSSTPDLDLERGRGLYLIRAKTDQVRVERGSSGVRVIMVKRR